MCSVDPRCTRARRSIDRLLTGLGKKGRLLLLLRFCERSLFFVVRGKRLKEGEKRLCAPSSRTLGRELNLILQWAEFDYFRERGFVGGKFGFNPLRGICSFKTETGFSEGCLRSERRRRNNFTNCFVHAWILDCVSIPSSDEFILKVEYCGTKDSSFRC